jgi:hypothetical protein
MSNSKIKKEKKHTLILDWTLLYKISGENSPTDITSIIKNIAVDQLTLFLHHFLEWRKRTTVVDYKNLKKYILQEAVADWIIHYTK